MMESRTKKPVVAVLFGERSVEHEISIITALELISAMDTTVYDVLPIYIDAHGRWLTGTALLKPDFYKNLPRSVQEVDEITLLPKAQGGTMPVLRSARPWWDHSAPKAYRADVFLVAMHGQYGEDGSLQGLLELAQVPYTCCNVTSSALAMDKYFCKNVFAAAGIPVLPAVLVSHHEVLQEAEKALDRVINTSSALLHFPVFVKPNHLGSSIGIGVARDRAQLLQQLLLVFRYDTHALIEPYINPITELNVAVRWHNGTESTPVEMPFTQHEALTYEDKYLGGGKKKAGGRRAPGGMVYLSRSIEPESVPESIRRHVQQYAERAYELLDARGSMRFDFIFDAPQGQLYFNELNPMPGSFAYYLWAVRKPRVLYTELIQQLITDAQQRFAHRAALERSIGFKALLQM